MTGRLLWIAAPLVLGLGSPVQAAAPEPWYCPKVEARVAVLGDSLADGLWGALFRAWQSCSSVTLLRVTEVSDGLTVTAPDEWSGRLAADLAGTQADIVVVQMGANDIRPVRTETGRAVFGTPEWDTAYAARGQSLLADLRQMAGTVVWVGLPVVGDDKLEAAYTRVSAVQSALVGGQSASDPETLFVDIHAATGFGTGGYVQAVTFGETLTQLRISDRIHFTDPGYDLVAQEFRRDLEHRLKARDNAANLESLALQ
jgi:uncharacterized protein